MPGDDHRGAPSDRRGRARRRAHAPAGGRRLAGGAKGGERTEAIHDRRLRGHVRAPVPRPRCRHTASLARRRAPAWRTSPTSRHTACWARPRPREALAEGKNVQQLDDRALDRTASRESGARGGHEGRGGTPRGRAAGNMEAPSARLLPRRSARRTAPATGLTHRGDGPASRRLDRQATEDEALDADDPGRRADAQHYRDILAASLDYAVREGWLDANPLASVKRASKRQDHDRILRRDDFYDPDEIDRLLAHAPACSRKRSGCAAHTPACVCRARRWDCDGAPSTSRRA